MGTVNAVPTDILFYVPPVLPSRPLDTLDRKEKYFMRADRKGDVYDREAMKEVSKQLGHNRIDVIAGHYLYTPKLA